jgi:hypothetical protein
MVLPLRSSFCKAGPGRRQIYGYRHDPINQTIGQVINFLVKENGDRGIGVSVKMIADKGAGVQHGSKQYKVMLYATLDPSLLPDFIDGLEKNYLSRVIYITIKRIEKQ